MSNLKGVHDEYKERALCVHLVYLHLFMLSFIDLAHRDMAQCDL